MGDVDGDSGATGRGEGRLLGGRYRLADVLGRGGMGTVWRAFDEVLVRTVAVKELRFPSDVDEEEKRRLITRTLREAKAIARIRNSGAVTVYDVVDEDDRPWIVMELVEGRSLAEIIRADGPLEPRRAAEVGLTVLEVLRVAHREGILHRDVKPSNVLIAEDDGRVVLTDFGIAKVEGDPSVTSTGMLVGAPSYISPERARGRLPGPPSDLWSLGGLLYAAVEGHPPYDKGSAIGTLTAVMTDPLQPPKRAGALEDVIVGLLEKDPDKRLGHAQARALLERVLRPAVAASPVPEKDDPEPGPSAAEATRTEVLAAAPPDDTRDAPAASAGPAGSTASGAVPRRALLLGVAVVAVLAVLGTALAIGLGGGEDQRGSDAPDRAAASGGPSGGDDEAKGQGPETGEDKGKQGKDQDRDGAGGRSGSGDSSPGREHSERPSAGPEEKPELPDGYAAVSDGRFRFRMALPDSWRRTGIAGDDSGGIYTAPDGGYPKVQVDFTSTPGPSAVDAWRSLEPFVKDNSSHYRRISLYETGWRDYPTVADWTFERVEKGRRVRVLNRGFVVDGRRGYSIMITCAAGKWDDDECRMLRDTAYLTFQPLRP